MWVIQGEIPIPILSVAWNWAKWHIVHLSKHPAWMIVFILLNAPKGSLFDRYAPSASAVCSGQPLCIPLKLFFYAILSVIFLYPYSALTVLLLCCYSVLILLFLCSYSTIILILLCFYSTLILLCVYSAFNLFLLLLLFCSYATLTLFLLRFIGVEMGMIKNDRLTCYYYIFKAQYFCFGEKNKFFEDLPYYTKMDNILKFKKSRGR